MSSLAYFRAAAHKVVLLLQRPANHCEQKRSADHSRKLTLVSFPMSFPPSTEGQWMQPLCLPKRPQATTSSSSLRPNSLPTVPCDPVGPPKNDPVVAQLPIFPVTASATPLPVEKPHAGCWRNRAEPFACRINGVPLKFLSRAEVLQRGILAQTPLPPHQPSYLSYLQGWRDPLQAYRRKPREALCQ